MATPSSFLHLSTAAIDGLAESIKAGRAYLRRDSKLIFVCGGNSVSGCISNRHTFLDYATRHLTAFRFFRAEEVFDALDSPGSRDLLSVEDNLGKFSDCIIIFCESASAFAELGAFALSDQLVRHLLVINSDEFRSSTSFVSRGPIAKADKRSQFKPTIFADFSAILRCVPEVERRLGVIPHKRRKRLPVKGAPSFSRLDAKLRLLLLADLINLFSPVSRRELIEILRNVFPADSTFEIATELALGQTLRFFQAVAVHASADTFYRQSSAELIRFFDYGTAKWTILRSAILRGYFQRDRGRLKILTAMK